MIRTSCESDWGFSDTVHSTYIKKRKKTLNLCSGWRGGKCFLVSCVRFFFVGSSDVQEEEEEEEVLRILMVAFLVNDWDLGFESCDVLSSSSCRVARSSFHPSVVNSCSAPLGLE